VKQRQGTGSGGHHCAEQCHQGESANPGNASALGLAPFAPATFTAHQQTQCEGETDIGKVVEQQAVFVIHGAGHGQGCDAIMVY